MPRRKTRSGPSILAIIIAAFVLIPSLAGISVSVDWRALFQCLTGLAIPLLIIGAMLLLLSFAARMVNRQRREEEQRKLEQYRSQFQSSSMRYHQFVDVDPTQFEMNVARIFKNTGFEVEHTGQSGDGGIDLKMTRRGLSYIVQCKRYTHKPVGEPAIREFYGALVSSGAQRGYFITTSKFTTQARSFAKNKPITLVDDEALKLWVDKYSQRKRESRVAGPE